MVFSAIRFDLAAIYLVVALIVALATFILVRFIVRTIRSLGRKGVACDAGACAGCARSDNCGIKPGAGKKAPKKGRLQ